MRVALHLLILILGAGLGAGASAEPRCAAHDPLRSVYWGELHVHTALSSDAWLSRVTTTPDQAYRFAKGEPIRIPPLDADGNPTQTVRLDRPLDFAAVTDHAESMGLAALCTNESSAAHASEACGWYRELPPTPAYHKPGMRTSAEVAAVVCGEGGKRCMDAMAGPWSEIQRAATTHDDASDACRFTAFKAYEWSGARGGPLLHRNVVFRGEQASFPASSEWFPRPRDLRRHLEETCLEAAGDCDVLVIPHNSNTSQGTMWDGEYEPGESELAQARRIAALEPVIEIMQHKGDSECRNGFSNVLGAADELCDWEKMMPDALPECTGEEELSYGRLHCTAATGFARYGLARGIAEQARLGVNPYRFGFVAATDAHNGNPGDVAEKGWKGHVGIRDATLEARIGPAGGVVTNTRVNPGGLAAVWAEENSREAIFDALERRETYGTSGPRMAVRFFGGWAYEEAALCGSSEFARRGYAGGVPMGGTLPPPPEEAADGERPAPRFAIQALRDPGTERIPGVGLQRVQIVKVWPDAEGRFEQRVVDVVTLDPGPGPDPKTCAPGGGGADALCRVWVDPEFDPAQPVAYYARVLQRPTCRWTAHECASLAGSERPALCDAPRETVQERAWTSPIWYDPPRRAP